MEIRHLEHKHGGRITSITAIEHFTDEYGASWEFRGRVEWGDGRASESAHISPALLCFDHDDPEAKAECDAVMARLNDYLRSNGKWTGRRGWRPKAKSGSEALP